jgi:hypothetical protein
MCLLLIQKKKDYLCAYCHICMDKDDPFDSYTCKLKLLLPQITIFFIHFHMDDNCIDFKK